MRVNKCYSIRKYARSWLIWKERCIRVCVKWNVVSLSPGLHSTFYQSYLSSTVSVDSFPPLSAHILSVRSPHRPLAYDDENNKVKMQSINICEKYKLLFKKIYQK